MSKERDLEAIEAELSARGQYSQWITFCEKAANDRRGGETRDERELRVIDEAKRELNIRSVIGP